MVLLGPRKKRAKRKKPIKKKLTKPEDRNKKKHS